MSQSTQPTQNASFDFMATETNYLHQREFDFDPSDRPAIYPHMSYGKFTYPSSIIDQKDWECACPKFLAEQEHKQRNPLFAIQWSQGGKRALTGTSSGEIITWYVPNFEYEKATSVHKDRVQSMCWTNNEEFLISGDKQGNIVYSDKKISQKNKFQAHNQQCIRDLSFSMSSMKFISCSDDRTARIFDFTTTQEEICFEGHGSDVKSCDWHPFQSLVVTGSKDNYVKIWDPKSGKEVQTLQSHNNTINQVRWNPINGNWLLTGSRDYSLKVHDIRTMKEFNIFQRHEDQVTVVAWHPYKEELFASASHNGQIIYWMANSGHLYTIDKAHNTMIWGMAWHPQGHMIASTGNDHKIRFWSRNKANEDVPNKPYEQVITKWKDAQISGEDIDSYLMSQSKKFMKYRTNVFLLHKYALRIQHWFFRKRFNLSIKKPQVSKSELQSDQKVQISNQKYKKINGSTRIPKAAEKQIQKHLEEQKKKEEQALKQDAQSMNKAVIKPTMVKQASQSVIKTQPVKVIEKASVITIENGKEKERVPVTTGGTEKQIPIKQPRPSSTYKKDIQVNSQKEAPQANTNQPSQTPHGRQTARPQTASIVDSKESTQVITKEKPVRKVYRAPSAKDLKAETQTKLPITSPTNEQSQQQKETVKKHQFNSTRNQTQTRPNSNKDLKEQAETQKNPVEQITSTITNLPAHTPQIGGKKFISKDSKSASALQHQKKWGERQHSWNAMQLDSVQALVEKGWKDAEELKEKKIKAQKASNSKKPQKSVVQEITEEECEKQVEEIVGDAWQKAEELKEKKKEEKDKALKKRDNSKGNGNQKPRWGERKTSWKAADFDSVQALIEKAWQEKDQTKGDNKKDKKSARKAQESNLQKIEEENDSPNRKFRMEDNDSPLKRPVGQPLVEQVDSEYTEQNQALAKLIEADKLKKYLQSGTNTDIDDTSSYMCSQSSPFKRARRTRGERQQKKESKENSRIINVTNLSPFKTTNQNQQNHTPDQVTSQSKSLIDKQGADSNLIKLYPTVSNTKTEQLNSSQKKKLIFQSDKKAPIHRDSNANSILNTAQKEQDHHIFKEADSNIIVD